MNLRPVIGRELRAEARHAGTQWLRPLSAGVALAVAGYFWAWEASGPELFAGLHSVMFSTIWLLVPLMTADCISRERREQTLGLLFLTPLGAGEILLAKVLAHGLRAATVCVAVLPVGLLPLLVGGVAWTTIYAALLANASAFLWALSAGILASVLSRSVLGGLGWALLLASLFLVGHAFLNGLALHSAVAGMGRSSPSPVGLVGVGLLASWNPELVSDAAFRLVPPAARMRWLLASPAVVGASAIGLILVGWLSAWRMRNVWQERPPSPRSERVTRVFLRPRFAPGLFRALMRRRMERNPVGWLERRRWTSRVAVWSWLGLLAIAEVIILSADGGRDRIQELYFLLMALMGALAVVSAGSLRRERETGVLELLLTTPLKPRQIVAGRLRGIWAQFLPAVFLFAVVTFFVLSWPHSPWRMSFEKVYLAVGMILLSIYYLTVPVVGLWQSLRAKHYLSGLLCTVALVGIIPLVLSVGLDWVWNEWGGAGQFLAFILSSICLALGLMGAIALRAGVGWTVSLFLVAWLLFASLWVLLVEFSQGLRFSMWSPAHSMLLTLPSLLLAVAGWAQKSLLRDLGERNASRQPTRR